MPRLDLRDGQWADLREHITHATDKAIKRTRRRGDSDADVAFQAETLLAQAFVRDWRVLDPDGNPIPITDPDAMDRAPDDIVDAIVRQAIELWAGVTVPNPRTPPSSADSSSAST